MSLSLYIHIPWCVKKCPYCDFNSHAANGDLPEKAYIDALLKDLSHDLNWVQNRQIKTIFIGGGTPSMFEAPAYEYLFTELRKHLTFSSDIEITLEANPGTIERGRFTDYFSVGINRVSLGIQSFNDQHLKKLGRIHSVDDAKRAIDEINAAGYEQFNLDLMHGLPNQTQAEALQDLETALSFNPPHLSWYQLTIEPNTVFYSKPPLLPTDDALFEIEEAGLALLDAAGLKRYEVSAYAKPGSECRHNLNYWRFGDYLGIGAGAHAKVTDFKTGEIIRIHKTRQPKAYLSTDNFIAGERVLTDQELPFELLMNALRLIDGISVDQIDSGVLSTIPTEIISSLKQDGLLINSNERFQTTPKGLRFLNEVLERFL